MFQAFGLSYAPSPLVRPLFVDLNLSLSRGEKVALVGPNGVGKSKLLEILAGVLRPDAGRIVVGDRVAVVYLPQDFDLSFDGLLIDYLMRDQEDDPAMEAKIYRLAARLGIGEPMMERAFDTLSLGERMRAVFASLLVHHPDILLLDEPTNHLDVEAREWLESFLTSCSQTVLMACHDRAMVDAVADRVLELEKGQMTEYAGGYADMKHEKSLRHARQMETYEREKADAQRLKNAAEKALQLASTMTKKPNTGTWDPKQKAFFAGKQKAIDKRAKAILHRVAQRDPVEKPFEADRISLEFASKPLYASTALEVRRLTMGYPGRPLFSNLTFSLPRRGRLAIVGPNGCGKTTLFRLLLGEDSALSGEIVWAGGADVRVLSQERGALDSRLSILEALGTQDSHRARTLLACLGMRGDAAFKPVRVLSVGERTKAELVSMLLSPANVLILDEPTNHLDVASLEALEEALKQYPGAVIFTSHDRRFVELVAEEVIAL